MTQVSIIIPAYNAYNTVERAIGSVPSGWEIIVVDDCSDGEGYESLKEFRPEIRLARLSKNSGPGAARNRGIELATGEWITFLDADDMLSDNVRCVFEQIGNLDEIDIVAGAVKHDTSNSSVIWNSSFRITHGKLYRKSFIDKYNLRWHPKLRLYEDVYFATIAGYFAKDRIFSTSTVLYDQLYNVNSVTKQIKVKESDWLMATIKDCYEMHLAIAMQSTELIGVSLRHISEVEDRYDSCTPTESDKEAHDRFHRFIDYRRPISPEYKLSIIIPLYKSEELIQDTLQRLFGILGDNLCDTEILMTADPDGIDYSYDNVYYNTVRGYMGSNRNRMLRIAQGEYVYFLDHDDYLVNDGIDEFFDLDTNADIIELGEQTLENGELSNLYTANYCLHGKFYRTNFLRTNNILFSDKLSTSEDVYFNNHAHMLTNMILQKHDIPCCVWNRDLVTTMKREQNNREFLENYWYDGVRAWILASIHDGAINREWFYVQARPNLSWWVHLINKYMAESKNFYRWNLKVMASLYLLWDRWYNEDLFVEAGANLATDWIRTIRAMKFKLSDDKKTELINLMLK